MEKALWSSLVSIASGLSILEGLNKFLDSYHDIRDSYTQMSLSLDWFSRGKYQVRRNILLTLNINLDSSGGSIEVVSNVSQSMQEMLGENQPEWKVDKGKVPILSIPISALPTCHRKKKGFIQV